MVLLTLFCVAPGEALAAPKNQVLGVDVQTAGEGRVVRIRTSVTPTFTVFRLSDPMRVVVDISGGDLTKIEAPITIDDGLVDQIGVRQFNTDGFAIGRLIVGFSKTIAYDVQAEGAAVVIRAGVTSVTPITEVAPPPVAPIDRAAAERFDAARKEADAAATRAGEERIKAEQAARTAREQQSQAEKIATEAERLRTEAERAKAEALALRQHADEAIARDRAKAETAAREAEARVVELQKAALTVARSRADAERLAAEADRKRLQAEEVAATASAKHKQQVAEIEDGLARAQQEKQAAERAQKRAQLAKQEAEQAQALAESARGAAERASREIQTKLQEIGVRERDTQAALTRLDGEKRAVAAERERIASEKVQVASEKQQVEADKERIERERRAVASQQAAVESERTRLGQLETTLSSTQARLESERRAVADMQTKLAKAEAERREREAHATTVRKATTQEIEELNAERAKLERLRQSLEATQAEIQKDKATLADQRAKVDALKQAKVEAPKQAKAPAKPKNEKNAGRSKLANAAPETPPEAIYDDADAGAGAPEAMPEESAVAVARARLVGVEAQGDGDAAGVLLRTDRTPSYELERVENPPRLVLDLAETDRTVSRTNYGIKNPIVRRVRLGDHGNRLRVVFDLARADREPVVTATKQGLLVSFKRTVVKAAVSPSTTEAAREVVGTVVRDVRFTGNGEYARITLELDGAVQTKVDDRSAKNWVLELAGAIVPKRLEQSLDTAAYGSVVRMVSTYQVSTDPAVANVVVSLTGAAKHTLTRQGNNWVWEIRGQSQPLTVASAAAPQTAGFAAEATVLAASTPTQTRQGKKRLNLDLKDADIVNVLRLLAEVSGENIVAGDDVKGQVTLRLRDVPWDLALDTILKSKGYDKVRQNNILRIAPAERIRAETELELARKKAKEQVEDTRIKMITINYASAAEVVGQIKPLLTPRGTVQAESRTNTIILEDLESNLDRVVELIRRLDKQTPQVLIEARIVEASSNNIDEFGIQWGGTGQATAQQGTSTGLLFPNSIIASGGADLGSGNMTTGTSTPGRYAINLPATVSSNSGGALGFIFGSAGGAQLLNLRLSALEEMGKGRIVSSPRITTLDNKTAKIAQGIDIPITVVSAAGANTKFIKAALQLEVTPHVTNDGSVLLKIKTSKNEPSGSIKGAQGDPAIETKEAETEVLVKDGETTVIGGIYTRNTSESQGGVPVLSEIPVIGWLFKKKRHEDKRAELLVFITPRIVNRDESVVQNSSLPGKVTEAQP